MAHATLAPLHHHVPNPDSKIHGANMGPTWVLSARWAPFWPHKPCYQGSFQREQKHIITSYVIPPQWHGNVIPPQWHGTGSGNPSSSKTRSYLFYIVNIMGADVLEMQGARASATMIFSMPHASLAIIVKWTLNTLRPRQNGGDFTNIFKRISLNENVSILIKI